MRHSASMSWNISYRGEKSFLALKLPRDILHHVNKYILSTLILACVIKEQIHDSVLTDIETHFTGADKECKSKSPCFSWHTCRHINTLTHGNRRMVNHCHLRLGYAWSESHRADALIEPIAPIDIIYVINPNYVCLVVTLVQKPLLSVIWASHG